MRLRPKTRLFKLCFSGNNYGFATHPLGLRPPVGFEIMGASSDHLILESNSDGLCVGAEVALQLNYSALVRSMTSPYVTRIVKS